MIFSAIHNRLIAATLATFCFFLAATIVAWKISSEVVVQEARNRFYNNSAQIKDAIQERLNLHTLAIEGLRETLEMQGVMSANQWSRYVQRLGLSEKYPGISSIGYIAKEVKNGKTSFVIRYVEPLAGREKAIGVDYTAEEKRRQTIERARDTGQPAATGKMILITTNAPGFLLVVPVYDSKTDASSSLATKRAAISGFVFAAFRGDELFRASLGQTNPYPNLDFEVYDGDGFSESNLLYDHDPKKTIADQPNKSQLSTKETIAIDSQQFILVAQTSESLGLERSQAMLPKIVLIGGLITSFLFLLFFLYQYRLHLQSH